jgi:hypothetical protein
MLPLVLGGAALLGYMGQQESASQQRAMQRQAQDILNSVPLPILKEYYPELYKQVGELAPEMLQAQELGQTEMAGISLDPALRQAQMSALSKLTQIGEEGGMTATDRARLAQIQAEQTAALRGQTGAIMQNLAARGMSGGMSEMVARQMAAQESANRAAQQGLDVKAQAEQRALQALMQSGQLGGQMEQQQFGQAAQIAQAKDAIARFNAQNLQNVAQQNVQARNLAQAQNLQTRQGIAGQNVGLQNQAQMYNLGLPQQQYQNQMARATGQATGIQNQAALAAQQQQAQNQFLGGLLQTGAMYYGGQQQKPAGSV